MPPAAACSFSRGREHRRALPRGRPYANDRPAVHCRVVGDAPSLGSFHKCPRRCAATERTRISHGTRLRRQRWPRQRSRAGSHLLMFPPRRSAKAFGIACGAHTACAHSIVNRLLCLATPLVRTPANAALSPCPNRPPRDGCGIGRGTMTKAGGPSRDRPPDEKSLRNRFRKSKPERACPRQRTTVSTNHRQAPCSRPLLPDETKEVRAARQPEVVGAEGHRA